jgi:hypothetical protein
MSLPGPLASRIGNLAGQSAAMQRRTRRDRRRPAGAAERVNPPEVRKATSVTDIQYR